MVRFQPDGQVKCQGNKGTFRVIADQCIRGVFILPVIFDPCIETGFGNTLFEMSTSTHDIVDSIGNLLQVSTCIYDATPSNGQVIVITGESLKEPQKPGVCFLLQIIGSENRRFDSFDVPCVKIFMTAKSEKLQIVLIDFLWGGGMAVFGRQG